MSKEITNKEVINKLCDYFMTQDRTVVSRLCANLIIDLNRYHYDYSCPHNISTLKKRIDHLMQQVNKLINKKLYEEELTLSISEDWCTGEKCGYNG